MTLGSMSTDLATALATTAEPYAGNAFDKAPNL